MSKDSEQDSLKNLTNEQIEKELKALHKAFEFHSKKGHEGLAKGLGEDIAAYEKEQLARTDAGVIKKHKTDAEVIKEHIKSGKPTSKMDISKFSHSAKIETTFDDIVTILTGSKSAPVSRVGTPDPGSAPAKKFADVVLEGRQRSQSDPSPQKS